MTSPLHGEGHRFESGRAHCFSAFFNEISSKIASSAFDEKLPTLQEKLSTHAKVSEFTSTREGVVAISGLASSSRLSLSFSDAPIETDKHTLGNLTLSFTSDELSYYVERRNIGLAGKSQDWISAPVSVVAIAAYGASPSIIISNSFLSIVTSFSSFDVVPLSPFNVPSSSLLT